MISPETEAIAHALVGCIGFYSPSFADGFSEALAEQGFKVVPID